MAREKLDLPLPFVFDPHMIGPEPAPVGRLALIGKVAHDDANRHAARGGGMREQRLQSPTALKAWSKSAITSSASSSTTDRCSIPSVTPLSIRTSSLSPAREVEADCVIRARHTTTLFEMSKRT